MEPTPPAALLSRNFICAPLGRTRQFLIPHLLLPWQAFTQGLITARGLRTYCAASEVAERRTFSPKTPTFRPQEFAALLGHGRPSVAEHDIADLDAIGLLRFRTHSLQFAESPEEVRGLDHAAYEARRQRVHPARRRACIPRRMVRYLARPGAPALIATVFGVALRISLHPQTRVYTGAVSHRWLETTFGLSERNAYRSLETIENITYLLREDTPAWHNRDHGRRYRLNHTWTPPDRRPTPPAPTTPARCKKMAELPEPSCKKMAEFTPASPAIAPNPPPLSPFQEEGDQHQGISPPADPDPPPLEPTPAHAPDEESNPGVMLKDNETRNASPGAPTLNHLVIEDLTDMPRLMALHRQAVFVGLSTNTLPARVAFVGLAEHALRVGTENPCGLFKTNLRQQFFTSITDADDHAAQVRLKAYDHGVTQARAQPPPVVQEARGSVMDDALRVRALTLQMAGELGHREVLAWLRTKDPARWTSAHVRDVVALLAQWATGGAAHAPPTRLVELSEDLARAAPSTCPECGVEPEACLCLDHRDEEAWPDG